MKYYRARNRACTRCGETFLARSATAKYCATCRPLARQEYKRALHKKQYSKLDQDGYRRHGDPCKNCEFLRQCRLVIQLKRKDDQPYCFVTSKGWHLYKERYPQLAAMRIEYKEVV